MFNRNGRLPACCAGIPTDIAMLIICCFLISSYIEIYTGAGRCHAVFCIPARYKVVHTRSSKIISTLPAQQYPLPSHIFKIIQDPAIRCYIPTKMLQNLQNIEDNRRITTKTSHRPRKRADEIDESSACPPFNHIHSRRCALHTSRAYTYCCQAN